MRVILKPWNEIAANHHIADMQKEITRMALELCEPYTPKDTGKLIESATAQDAKIVVSAPYARRWYYQPANFQGAPKRGNYWFERMKAEGGTTQILQEISNKHGVKFK